MAVKSSRRPKRIRRTEWFDNDSFWRDLYPFMFPEQRFTEAPEQIDSVIALTQPQGRSVLDLCCGPGRCSVAFAQKGFTVTGVDRTEFLLTQARARATAAGVSVEWIRQDMRDFVRSDAFDLAISMFTSFGYFDDKRDDIAVLGNLLASLRPGGTCLIEVMGKERLARILRPTTSDRLADGSMLVQRHEIFDSWTRVRNEWLLIRGDRVKSFAFHHTIYSGQELRDRLEQVGFTNVTLHGSLNGDEYSPTATRLVAVARKSER
jgi:SAM-dependent methyltransferase